MMKITDLAHVLQDQHQLSKNEAEFFISLLVDVLTTGLKADKQVKVKGLGTFKVTSVNARESVDVNSGERIIIEGREKISFTPEPALRDKVNSPFEQFETVTVSDDADFSEIDERYQKLEEQENADGIALVQPVLPMEEDKVDVEAQGSHQERRPTDQFHQAEMNGNDKVLSDNDRERLANPLVEDDAHEQEVIETPPTEEAPVVDEQPVLEEVNVTETTDDRQRTPITESEEDALFEPSEQNDLKEKNHQLRVKLSQVRRRQKILNGIVCALLLIACLGSYYINKQFADRDNRIEQLMAELHAVRQAQQMKKNEAAVHDNSASENTEIISGEQASRTVTDRRERSTEQSDRGIQDEKRKNEVTARASSESAKHERIHQNNQAMASKYDSDPRVRTGAYVITGVARTVTVSEGQTLSSISRTYLGPGMECYMEAVNQKKDIKEGDQVKIPELKLKKRLK